MKVAFLTLGCKVNFYETEKMMKQFRNIGFQIVENTEIADVYIINTCTVTNMADRKSRQMIRRGKKKNPDSIVVAVGCYAEHAGETLKEEQGIDIVLGNAIKDKVVSFVLEEMKRRGILQQEEQGIEIEQESTVHERTRAFIKVQDGCNQFCSYCIIPYVRGKLESRSAKDVAAEIYELAKKGFQEVVINGIHLSSYGIDFSDKKHFTELDGVPLLELLEEIAKIPEIKRIRLGSLEPRIITEKFVRRLKENEKVCPHFHLSLQSGCTETLKRMNRHYTAKDFEEKCRLLREFYENPAITTDVIVGFPGETKEEFETTIRFMEQVRLSDVHVFKYSVRNGTKAAKMENQIPETVKTERSARLIALTERIHSEYAQSFIGTRQKVLWEEFVTHDGKRMLCGHSERYVKVLADEAEIEENGYRENEISEVLVKRVC